MDKIVGSNVTGKWRVSVGVNTQKLGEALIHRACALLIWGRFIVRQTSVMGKTRVVPTIGSCIWEVGL